jgi:SH3 domain protein
MMRFPRFAFGFGLAGLLCTLTTTTAAQDTQYISDQVLVPMRSGAGTEYRIIHRGLPSGTQLQTYELSDDGDWREVETLKGLRGWVREQYLQAEPPAALTLARTEAALSRVTAERDKLKVALEEAQSAATTASSSNEQMVADLDAARSELAEIKRLSANAIELDQQNQTLITDLETQRANAELLRLENVRLQERINSNLLLDGALAVLLGVIITLVAPRLWPSKRRNDGWI